MGHSNGHITAPVGIEDLRQTLGTSSADIGKICDEANINPASRRKPIRHPNKGEVSDAEMKEANYGLRFNTAFAPDLLELGYTYVRTTGNDVRRYTDFRDYHHDSQLPMRGYGDIVLRPIGGSSHVFWFMGRMPSIYDLQLGDFPALENFYPCLVLFFPSGSYLWKTGSVKFGEQGNKSVEITYDELNRFVNKGPYTYKLCGFSAKQTSFNDAQQFGQFISLPSDEDLTGIITLSNTINVSCDFLYIKDQILSGENDFEDIKKYSGALSIDGPSDRFGVMWNGDIALVARITNNEPTDLSFYKSRLIFHADRTIMSNDEVETAAAQTYDMTMAASGLKGTAVLNSSTVLTIKSGETKYVGFNLPGLALITDASGSIGFPTPGDVATADMIIALRYEPGSASTLLGSVWSLRVTTGPSTSDGGGLEPPIISGIM